MVTVAAVANTDARREIRAQQLLRMVCASRAPHPANTAAEAVPFSFLLVGGGGGVHWPTMSSTESKSPPAPPHSCCSRRESFGMQGKESAEFGDGLMDDLHGEGVRMTEIILSPVSILMLGVHNSARSAVPMKNGQIRNRMWPLRLFLQSSASYSHVLPTRRAPQTSRKSCIQTSRLDCGFPSSRAKVLPSASTAMPRR